MPSAAKRGTMHPMAEQSLRLRSARTTTELYRACMSLAVEARSLLVQNEGMKRLGLNAQILAAHVGEKGSSLEVIVAEIGQLSTLFRDTLTALGTTAQDLSARAIGILHLAHRHGSYSAGWNVGIAESSSRIYRDVLDSVASDRTKRLETLEADMGRLASLVDDLERAARRIPPVTTLILIVAAEIRIHTTEILATVEDLKSFHGHLASKIERMSEIRAAGAAAIGTIEREDA